MSNPTDGFLPQNNVTPNAEDQQARDWTLNFERRSVSKGGTDGWRMSDGGQTIELPGNRILWLWGDTFSSYYGLRPDDHITHFTFADSPCKGPCPMSPGAVT
jgi:hypothetical protein